MLSVFSLSVTFSFSISLSVCVTQSLSLSLLSETLQTNSPSEALGLEAIGFMCHRVKRQARKNQNPTFFRHQSS